MPSLTIDRVYRSLLLTKFFTKGWGKPEHLKRIFELRRRLAVRDTAVTYVDRSHPVTIVKDIRNSDHRLLEGYFTTPFVQYLPQLLPPESERAHFQMILPLEWKSANVRPVCVQYAGTGDHFFWRRRRLMGLPMLKERGVASIILENPFYGLRKPKQQFRSSLQQVSDLFVMGASLILESLVLFHWCEREGFYPIIAHGISMGGHMASLGATVWPKPIGLVPCLSWTSASVTFTKGVLTGAIPWDVLEKQYIDLDAYRDEIAAIVKSEANAFQAGVEFAQAMDMGAQIRDERRNAYFQDGKNNSSDSNYKILSDTTPCDQDDLMEEQMLRRQISDAEEAEADKANKFNTNYNSMLETLKVPLPPSLKIETLTSRKTSDSVNNNGKSGEDSWLKYMLPKVIRNDAGGQQGSQQDSLHREAVQFMRGIMDECTHLKNYSVPFDPSLIHIVVAENDGYQPRDGIAALPEIWPGSKVKYIPGKGHVSSYLFKQDLFRQSIYDCLDSLLEKYPSPP